MATPIPNRFSVGDPLALRRHLPRRPKSIWTNEPAQRGSAPLSRLAISPLLIFATLFLPLALRLILATFCIPLYLLSPLLIFATLFLLLAFRLILATLLILSRLILLPLPLASRLITSTLLRLVLRPPITG